MRKLFWSTIFLSILSFTLVTCSQGNHASGKLEALESLSSQLRRLDSLIDERENIAQRKQMKISEIRQKLNAAMSVNNRYLYNSLLADEYFTYNADSALAYINAALQFSRKAGNKEWTNTGLIRKSELLTATGLLDEARDLMHSIDRSSLTDHQLIDYYGCMIFLYSHLGDYSGGVENDYYYQERMYRDSIMTVIDPSHPDYFWYKSWAVLGTGKTDAALIDALTARMDSSNYDTATDAKLAYVLSKLYEEAGDMVNYPKYMALSAIADVNIANADIASLEELATIVFANGKGDIDKAYSYITYCLNSALKYPNRVRSFNISNTMDSINRAYHEKSQNQQLRTRHMLIFICVLAMMLLGMIVVVIVQNERLRRRGKSLDQANRDLNNNVQRLSEAHQELNKVNDQLVKLNEDLKQKNEDLNEANYVKEEYIGSVFTLCSNYIGKLESMKRTIHVKAIAKKFKDILSDTEDLEMKDEMKEFYRSFDSIFLHIYPNFVTDFNMLLQDDKKIWPKEGELLNTELRIYALVRLGITDSIKIAEFLHCSPQTVYNNRFKVRNKALISKKVFADTVRTLGRYQDKNS